MCRSGEKHEPASDINAAAADGLKALDPPGRLENGLMQCSKSSLFNHVVGQLSQIQGHIEVERLRGLAVDARKGHEDDRALLLWN